MSPCVREFQCATCGEHVARDMGMLGAQELPDDQCYDCARPEADAGQDADDVHLEYLDRACDDARDAS